MRYFCFWQWIHSCTMKSKQIQTWTNLKSKSVNQLCWVRVDLKFLFWLNCAYISYEVKSPNQVQLPPEHL
jgi:hypothetical protein